MGPDMGRGPVSFPLCWNISNMALRALSLTIALAVCPSWVSAAIYAPGDSVPGTRGEVFGWSRGDANSTYSGWNTFEYVVAASMDPMLPASIPLNDNTPDVAGQFGTPSSVSTTGGWLPVGSGNLYSPIVALDFSSVIRSGTTGGPNTRIVAQFQTGGSEFDYSSILLSSDVGIDGTVAPDMMVETGRIPLGGFGGDRVNYLAVWDLVSSQPEFRIDFNASESSLSWINSMSTRSPARLRSLRPRQSPNRAASHFCVSQRPRRSCDGNAAVARRVENAFLRVSTAD